MGGVCVPCLLLDLKPNCGGGNEDNGDLLQKVPCNYPTIALISHTSKVTLKILQVRLQQYVNREFPEVQAGFRKGRGTRDQIVNICCIIGKIGNLGKTSTPASLTTLKPLTSYGKYFGFLFDTIKLFCQREHNTS